MSVNPLTSLDPPRKRQFWIPYNGTIAVGLTHADTNKHTLNLESALNEKRRIVGLLYKVYRTTGSGGLRIYPNEGETNPLIACGGGDVGFHEGLIIIKERTQRLQYALTIINDVFTIYCLGYLIEA